MSISPGNIVTTHCRRCGEALTDRRRAEKALYCGRECYTAVRRAEQGVQPRPCAHCGTSFTPSFKRRAGKYCSLTCQRKETLRHDPEWCAQISRATVQMRGDQARGSGKGYEKRGGRHEHRVVMEQKLGRPLLPNEIVHHIDRNKKNNHPDNLELLTQSAHVQKHRDELNAARTR